jgi:hypothetical protein
MTNFYWKKFPIKTDTACQSKWTWSTIWLNEGTSSSCHRVKSWDIDPNNFSNFHNLPEKLEDRQRMLQGLWPESGRGCEYCKNIEDAGGFSDRMHNNNIGGYTPHELVSNPSAIVVTPKIVEIFAKNTCNLSCIYCHEDLSSKIEIENKKYGRIKEIPEHVLAHRKQVKLYKQKMYNDFLNWLDDNVQSLGRLHLLGGETFIQHDLMEKVFEILARKPNKFLQLNIFSNFNTPKKYFFKYINQIKDLTKNKNIGRFDLTCSIDCWGPQQEYVRSGLNLELLEEYFAYAAEQDEKWLWLNVNQTISSMTIKTMPDLITKINKYSVHRHIGHYFQFLDGFDFQHPQIFDYSLWEKDFENILKTMQKTNQEKRAEAITRMMGHQKMLEANCKQNDEKIKELHKYLDELDRRRGTNWRPLFPYLIV